ncbi:MAG TPA: toll/interleukin-1 receptor domain-containing protein, partial [Gemmatimonadaceae bacterium]
MPTKKLFISHASVDKSFVNRLVARLREDHVDVWYDTFDVDAATEDLHERFRAGVADAEFFAIVLTPRSQASQWVSYEANIAMEQKKSILAIVADAPRGHYDFLRNPHLNDLLRGGRRVVVDFTVDFERGLDQLLLVVAPDVGRRHEVERNLRVILESDDPDAAELAMTEAGLTPEAYLPRLTKELPDLRDDAKVSYRVERAMSYLGEPAIETLFGFLLRLTELPSADIPFEIPHTSNDDGSHIYKGDAFTDVLRHVILTGGNRAWAAQIGARRCLVAAASRDPLVRADIRRHLHSTLEEILQVVTVRKHDGEFTDSFFDATRLAIETIGLLETGKAETDPWVIEQFVTTKLWGDDNASTAKDKLTSYVVDCLARIGSAKALA